MLITPAEFEDKMNDAESVNDVLHAMVETLDSLGYGAGVKIMLKRFLFREGEEK